MKLGVQTTGHGEVAVLNWKQDDIEQKLGFSGGQFTSANRLLSFVGAVVMTILWYVIVLVVVLCIPVPKPAPAIPAEMPTSVTTTAGTAPAPVAVTPPLTFWKRAEEGQFSRYFCGHMPMPPLICLLFFWGLAILFVKSRKLKHQRLALDLAAVPRATDFVLDRRTAVEVLKRVNKLVDSPSHFILLNRLERALSNLRNIGNISEVSHILRTQAEYDEEQVASSYKLVAGFVWAIPVLGFIGTVRGLSEAMFHFGGTLESMKGSGGGAGGLPMEELVQVGKSLSIAFDVTFIALAATLVLQLYLTHLQHDEASFLDECNDYCHANVVSKLRLSDDA